MSEHEVIKRYSVVLVSRVVDTVEATLVKVEDGALYFEGRDGCLSKAYAAGQWVEMHRLEETNE